MSSQSYRKASSMGGSGGSSDQTQSSSIAGSPTSTQQTPVQEATGEIGGTLIEDFATEVEAPESSLGGSVLSAMGLGERSTDGVDVAEKTATIDEASEKTIIEQFTELVDQSATSPDEALSLVAYLALQRPSDAAALVADTALLKKTLNKVGLERSAMALNYLQFGASDDRSMVKATKLLAETTGLSDIGWRRLAAGRPSGQLVPVLTDAAAFAAVKELPGDPLDLMPGLAMDPPAMLAMIENNQFDFFYWVQERGGDQRLDELLDAIIKAEDARIYRDMMMKDGKWNAYLDSLDSPATEDATRRKLYYYFLAAPDGSVSEQIKLFEVRFNVELGTDSGARWDKPSILRLWQICDLSPDSHVAANVKVVRESMSGEASGWAYQGEVGMTWGTNTLGNTEIGAYTQDQDVMRGLNVFDACVRHEIGHNVDDANDYSGDGGWVRTEFGWDQHTGGDFRSMLEDVFLPKYPLPLNDFDSGERAGLRDEILEALAGVQRFNSGGYQMAIERVKPGLWRRISDEPLIQYLLQRSQMGQWNKPDEINGRSYHVAYDWYGFTSVPTGAYANKVSTYAMRCEYEWFAEAYATFYANADMPGTELGSLVKDKNGALHKRMLNTVHPKDDFATVTGQGDVGIPSAEEMKEGEENKQPDQNPAAQSKEANAPSHA